MDYESHQPRKDSLGRRPDGSAPLGRADAVAVQGATRLAAIGPLTLRSWIVLAASLGLALAIYYGFLGSSWVDLVAGWTADWTSRGLNAMGGSTSVSGTILVSDSFAVNVVAECTAVGPLVLFFGAIVAFPASLKAKGIGAAIGLVVLTLVNLVRIMSLFWIGSSYPEYLDMAHLLVWQSASILLAIVMWLVWVEGVTRARNV